MMTEVEECCLWCWAYMRFGVSWCCKKYSLVLMGLVGGGSSGGYQGVLGVSHAPASDGGLIVMRMRYSGSTCGCLLRCDRAGSSRRGNRRLGGYCLRSVVCGGADATGLCAESILAPYSFD